MPNVKKPRVNKTKAELEAQMAHLSKVAREKSLVKLMFPAISNIKTIYDAQTVLGALGGFIKTKLDEKVSAVLVKELVIDLSKEADSEIKTAMLDILGLIGPEKAKDVSSLLERFGNILAQHSAREYMKQPMVNIKVEQLVSE